MVTELHGTPGHESRKLPRELAHRVPRLIIAAASSSAGKTTIATGLMAALTQAGHRVAGFKVGPDFIDPGFHALATGRPGRNLDPVMVGEHLVPRLFLHGLQVPAPADLAIVEGVMGLFDGQLNRDGFGSTAHVARLLDAPVVLVLDAAGSSRTPAATALGVRELDPGLNLAGVIVNRVASPRHGAELAGALEHAGIPVLGMVPRSRQIQAPSRHLGLVPAAERRESGATVEALGAHIAEHVDLSAVVQVAASAPALEATAWSPAEVVHQVPGSPLVAMVSGRAFTFRYPETTELLEAAGCRIAEIDPLLDRDLPPDTAALWIGGGFPEVYAPDLSRNAALRAAIHDAVLAGLPTLAECAGQLYLAEHLDGHAMVGVLPASARMTPRLTLGYREAIAPQSTLIADAGTRVIGHEFHRTRTEPGHGPGAQVDSAWRWGDTHEGFSADPAHTGRATLHTSYLHLHWAGAPSCAQHLADAAASFAADPGRRVPGAADHSTAMPAAVDGIDLAHHGDHDTRPGLVDLAVNVLTPGPPGWLARIIAETIPALGSYPDPAPAREAIAASHGVDPAMVLPTAGGAEAFMLVARTLEAAHPIVVHPQFTEPEAALRAVGAQVQRWLLPVRPDDGPASLADLPTWADAVFVGNPTNPTGWLHTRDALHAAGRDRILVVDEAFMDATDEAQSLIAPSMDNTLVLRSLSKTWGLAGLRVGYVVGDPRLIARLERAQAPWPVSAPAIAAMEAVRKADALREARRRYANLPANRRYLVDTLREAGFPAPRSDAPFVLVDTSACGPASVREPLATAGLAVRRGESFPGLGPTWIRVRVPPPQITDRLVAALTTLRR